MYPTLGFAFFWMGKKEFLSRQSSIIIKKASYLLLLQKLKNPTRYHVLQSHKRQMREYVNHKHHLLGPPKTTFQPHSAPETVPGGRKEEDETIITTRKQQTGLTRSSNNVSNSQQSYFCSTSAPEVPAPQISTKEASAEVVAAVEREAVSLLSSLREGKASKSKCESPERINFNTDNASAVASASKVRPLHRSWGPRGPTEEPTADATRHKG